MALLVTCQCGGQYHTDASNLGREARCVNCGQVLTVTNRSSAEDASRDTKPPRAPICGKAVLSLILGVTALALTVLTGLAAIVLGVAGLAEVRRSRGRIRGQYLAIAGIALGVFGSTVIPFVVASGTIALARKQRDQAACYKHLQDIKGAMFEYHNARDRLPMAAVYDRKGRPLLSWRVLLLPFIGADEVALFEEFHLDEPWDSPHNRTLIARMPSVYACPKNAAAGSGMTTYQALVGPGTLFEPHKAGRIANAWRVGSTILVVEADRPVPWTAPEDIPYDPAEPAVMNGVHHEGLYYAFNLHGQVLSLHAEPSTTQATGTASPKIAKP